MWPLATDSCHLAPQCNDQGRLGRARRSTENAVVRELRERRTGREELGALLDEEMAETGAAGCECGQESKCWWASCHWCHDWIQRWREARSACVRAGYKWAWVSGSEATFGGRVGSHIEALYYFLLRLGALLFVSPTPVAG